MTAVTVSPTLSRMGSPLVDVAHDAADALRRVPWKKVLAVFLVTLMIFTGVSLIMPTPHADAAPFCTWGVTAGILGLGAAIIGFYLWSGAPGLWVAGRWVGRDILGLVMNYGLVWSSVYGLVAAYICR
jgi:FtsH-binding integral membrane protein